MEFSRPARWLAWLVLLAGTVAGDGKSTPDPRSILHLDLRTLGAVKLELPGPLDSHTTYAPGSPDSLTFLDDFTLAVSFPVLNPRTELSTRKASKGGSHLFHTAVVDLRSGHVASETSWDTAHDQDIVLAISGDRFLVRSGEKLAIVSRGWKREREYPLPRPGPGELPARVLPSPTGNTLFVIMNAGEHREHVTALATRTLEALHDFTIESVGLDAASDSRFAYLLPGKKGFALFELPLSALGKGALPPLEPLYFAQQDGCNHPYFATDDLLVLTGYCDHLTLVSPDGGPKVAGHIGSTSYWGPLTPSRDQHRFAVHVSAWAGQLKMEGPPDPIRVYEVSQLAQMLQMELPPPPAEHIPRIDFALSPDGSLLAVLLGYDLSVYQLPPPLTALSSPPSVGPRTDTPPESGPDARIETHARPGIVVSVVSLSDMGHDAIRAWVQIANHGGSDVALAPQNATLQVLSPKHKTLSALDPDALAGGIRYAGAADARQERSGCEENGEPECGKAEVNAYQIERAAEDAASEVRSSALRPQTLKAGQQVEGALFFAYQRQRGEVILRIPVGDQVFEFRFPPPSK